MKYGAGRLVNVLGFIFFILMPTSILAKESQQAISNIKAQMIQESINAYPGNCACPYNHARNGSKCGKRSAWSKGGGYAPLCYESDISEQMVRNFMKRQ